MSTDHYNSASWLLDRQVEAGRGERVAIRCEGASTTYAQVQAEVWRVQRGLSALGVGAGGRVAMVVNDEPAFPAWFLGCQRSGVVPVPLSTMLTGGELGEIVADSGAAVLVLSSTYADAVPTIAERCGELEHVIVIGDAETSSTEAQTHGSKPKLLRWDEFDDRDEVAVAATTVDSDAFWLYSSGTTGTPKGVMHTHGNLEATVDTYASTVLDVGENDRFLSVAKLFFAYGLGNSLTFPFSVGGTTVLHPQPPTPASMTELIVGEKPTLFFASPGFCAAMLDTDVTSASLESLRATVTAGESLPANVQTRFTELTGSPVLDGIGSTELLHIFISNTLTEQVPGSSGRVVDGYTAELRDDDDNVVTEPDTPGYLHVQGPSGAKGYWRREEATTAAFSQGWVRTGDVYVRSADDCWTFLGRNNDMIKAGGIWVSPAEVESVLIEHPDVLEAAVVGARNDEGLETTVAYIVAAAGADPDRGVLDQHCRDRMAAFKRPREILVVDELPKTATGKIKRFALRSAHGQGASQ